MKRYGNLYDKICDIDNLKLADKKARKAKQLTCGVRIFDRHYDENMNEIHEMLVNETYKTSEYKVKEIFDQKQRTIYVLPYGPDGIVHHAIMNVLEPIWVSLFVKNTYSCIKGRGTFLCSKETIRALNTYSKKQPVYCLKLDIRKFYPSIDHEILKLLIRKKIKCKKTLNLLDEIIDSAPGVPIGNYLSQFFANIYLTYFDHWVKEILKVKHYFRYADDIVILSHSKAYLRNILNEIQSYLLVNLKLMVKDNYQIFPVPERKEKKMKGRSIDFVGYCIFRKQVQIRKRIKQNFCRHMQKANKKPHETLNDYKLECSSWLGWCKYSDSVNLAKKIIKPEYYKPLSKIINYNYRNRYINGRD